MSNRKSNHNSLESMMREIDATSTVMNIPEKLNIINMNSRAQSGGSNYNSQLSPNNSYNHVNKLLSMLGDDSSSTNTLALEANLNNSLKMSGGKLYTKLSKKEELKAFFKKYNIHEVNGITTMRFIKSHGAPPVPPSDAETPVPSETGTSETGTSEMGTSETGTSDADTPAKPPNGIETTTGEQSEQHGGAGMNPGFQAFLNLKKKIAEELKISNGPKAAKIAGAVQREMKAKYTNLNSVEIAAKGMEHFKKNHDKYKKMV